MNYSSFLLLFTFYCFCPAVESVTLDAFGEHCKEVEEYLIDLGQYYSNITKEACETKKKDAPGTNPKDWEYIWKGVLEGVDITYDQKAVGPPKDKAISILNGARKECWKGSVCEEEVLQTIGDCMKKYLVENSMSIVDEEYMEKHMNDANCKLHLEYIKGEGGKKLNELAKRNIFGFDASSIRKE